MAWTSSSPENSSPENDVPGTKGNLLPGIVKVPLESLPAFHSRGERLAFPPTSPASESLLQMPQRQGNPESILLNLDPPWPSLSWINNHSGDVPVRSPALFR